MSQRKKRELKRRHVARSKFFELDGDVYYVSDRDAEGLEAVRLDDADAAVVRRMRCDGDIDVEAAVLARRR